jgi:hypothetical protein
MILSEDQLPMVVDVADPDMFVTPNSSSNE